MAKRPAPIDSRTVSVLHCNVQHTDDRYPRTMSGQNILLWTSLVIPFLFRKCSRKIDPTREPVANTRTRIAKRDILGARRYEVKGSVFERVQWAWGFDPTVANKSGYTTCAL